MQREKRKVPLVTIAALSVSLLTGFTGYELTKTKVHLKIDDNEQIVVKTHSKTVRELLREKGWDITLHDDLTPSLDTKITKDLNIEWRKAKPVIFTSNGEEKEVWTTAKTVKEFLDSIGVLAKENDKVFPSIESNVEKHMKISYVPSKNIRIVVNGESKEVQSTAMKVEELLRSHGIMLDELDRVEPAKDRLLKNKMEVRVIRVKKESIMVEEFVPFTTIKKEDNSLEGGQEKVLQTGKIGHVKKYYDMTFENEKEVAKELKKVEIIKNAKDHIVAVGTKAKNPFLEPVATFTSSDNSLNTSTNTKLSNDTNGKKTITMTATAYTADCKGCTGITKTGIDLRNNRHLKVIAVDPNVIPLGTNVYVEGYGHAIAADIGGAIKGNIIDLHMPTTTDALEWGRRQVEVTILD